MPMIFIGVMYPDLTGSLCMRYPTYRTSISAAGVRHVTRKTSDSGASTHMYRTEPVSKVPATSTLVTSNTLKRVSVIVCGMIMSSQ